MSGNDFAKYIRNSEWAHMPIIAITGYHDDVDQELFDSILQKPFELKILSKIIQMLIAKKERFHIANELKDKNVNIAFAEQ